jgi:hypothetical protein
LQIYLEFYLSPWKLKSSFDLILPQELLGNKDEGEALKIDVHHRPSSGLWELHWGIAPLA